MTAWATVTAKSVRVGDRVQRENGRGRPLLLRFEDLRTARADGKRLTLEDGSVYLLPATGTLRGSVQLPQATP